MRSFCFVACSVTVVIVFFALVPLAFVSWSQPLDMVT